MRRYRREEHAPFGTSVRIDLSILQKKRVVREREREREKALRCNACLDHLGNTAFPESVPVFPVSGKLF